MISGTRKLGSPSSITFGIQRRKSVALYWNMSGNLRLWNALVCFYNTNTQKSSTGFSFAPLVKRKTSNLKILILLFLEISLRCAPVRDCQISSHYVTLIFEYSITEQGGGNFTFTAIFILLNRLARFQRVYFSFHEGERIWRKKRLNHFSFLLYQNRCMYSAINDDCKDFYYTWRGLKE